MLTGGQEQVHAAAYYPDQRASGSDSLDGLGLTQGQAHVYERL
jgi:hypothetical protein